MGGRDNTQIWIRETTSHLIALSYKQYKTAVKVIKLILEKSHKRTIDIYNLVYELFAY